jgi:hypothetical protein
VNDTAPWAAAKMAELMARRSPEERVRMASRSFDAARQLVLAGVRRDFPGVGPRELRLRLLERTYAADFTPEAWQRMLSLWKQRERL